MKKTMDVLVKQPGPKPGSSKAISQRKAISEGYAATDTPRRTKMNQKNKSTGTVKVPGLTNRK